MEEKEAIEAPIAKFLSYLLHPLFMPLYGLLLLFYSNRLNGFNYFASEESKQANMQLFVYVFIFNILIPLGFAYLLKKRGKIESLEMEKKEDRQMPFLITAISYFLGFIVIQKEIGSAINPFLIWILVGAELSIIATLIISLFWKISIHMIGIGGLVGINILMMKLNMEWDYYFYASILLAGLLAYARLKLEAHTFAQVLAGFIIGILSEAIFLLG
ncbi:MAG: hypothetical protein ACO3EE_03175 [Flavobacteriales bacterium]